jgi:hypothetical protein
MNDELERVRKEAVVTYLKVIFRHSLGGTEKTNKNLGQGNQCSGRCSNREPP